MSTTHALVALANTCATASTTTLPSAHALVYTSSVLKSMVPEKRQTRRGCKPHLQAGFCHAQIPGTGAPALAPHGSGRGGHIRKDCRTTSSVFFTPRPPAAMKTQTVVFLDSLEGTKTMTHVPQGRTTPTTQATSATHPHQLFADAVNAASMASWYTRRGNIAAAARKARQHLAALRLLAKLEGGAA